MPVGVYKRTEECKRKLSLAKKNSFGEKNNHWKGNNIKVGAIHRRIVAKLGKPSYCEVCKRTDKKRYDWSNKDHKYSLDLKDWQRLCVSCHQKWDRKYNNYQKDRYHKEY